jgi:hypothetical protein
MHPQAAGRRMNVSMRSCFDANEVGSTHGGQHYHKGYSPLKCETSGRRMKWLVGRPEFAEWQHALTPEFLIDASLGELRRQSTKKRQVRQINRDGRYMMLLTSTARTLPIAERAMRTEIAFSALSPYILRMNWAATSRLELRMSSLGMAANYGIIN